MPNWIFFNVYNKYRTYILSTLTFQNKRILKPWEIIKKNFTFYLLPHIYQSLFTSSSLKMYPQFWEFKFVIFPPRLLWEILKTCTHPIIPDFGKFLNVGTTYTILPITETAVNTKTRLETAGKAYWRYVPFFK